MHFRPGDRYTETAWFSFVGHRCGYFIYGPSQLDLVPCPGGKFNCFGMGYFPGGEKVIKGGHNSCSRLIKYSRGHRGKKGKGGTGMRIHVIKMPRILGNLLLGIMRIFQKGE